MAVIYAEKPDMAEKIAFSLGGNTFNKSDKKNGYYTITYNGKDYQVTWGYGHLCGLADAYEYNASYKNWGKMPIPFIPDDYKIILKEQSFKAGKDAYKIIHRLFKNTDYIINATDFDREGELIFYYLYTYDKCTKPVMRIKLASTTPNGIREAFDNMIPGTEMGDILNSARCRSIADWVVGCNLTALMTVKTRSRSVIPIGRVQTPTLNMVVKRDEEIENFKPEDYYTLEGTFTTGNGEKYKGDHKTKKFTSKIDAENIKRKCSGSPGIVTKVENTSKTRYVPNLYNLDLLQMDANGIYGISIKKTLDTAQSLYEKGFITYPRSDCQFLPNDMFDKMRNIQEGLRQHGYAKYFNQDASEANMKSNRGRFFDDSKLGSHYAIVPTELNAYGMTPDEQKIYDLIAFSVIRMLYPNATIENKKVVTTVNGEDFITNGSSIKNPGWMFVEGKTKETFIPNVSENEVVSSNINIFSKKTEPPKHYTDKTLLSAMISAGKSLEDDELKQFMLSNKIDGIGTVATRASIIENLISRDLLQRNKKNIVSTDKGRKLIHIIPIEQVKSASLTAKYEKRLNQISLGQEAPERFLGDMYAELDEWCRKINQLPIKEVTRTMAENTNLICPACGAPLMKYDWGYGCSNHTNGCGFTIGSKIAQKTLSENQIKNLIEKKKIGPVSGFISKAGKKFDAFLVLNEVEENGTTKYRVNFEFPERESLEKDMPDIYAQCPNCGGKIIKGRFGWVCEKNCGVSVPYSLCQRNIKPSEAEALLNHGATDILDGFISKKEKPFSAGLKLNGTRTEFYFPERNSN